MKKLTKILPFLALTALEFVDNEVSLSKDQIQSLQDNFKKQLKKDVSFEGVEYDDEGFAQISYETLLQLEEIIPDDFVFTAEEKTDPIVKSKTEDPVVIALKSQIDNLQTQLSSQETILNEIKIATSKDGIADPLIIQNKKNIPLMKKQFSLRERVVSAGYLFNEPVEYLKLENRPWNLAAASMLAGESVKPFLSEVDLTQLNNDFGAFVAGRKGDIVAWFTPNDEFNKSFPKITGVSEGDLFMSLDITPLTQAYQKDWTPSGDVVFYARKPKLFDIKIDLEFDDLKAIERTWLSEFNNEGSNAYKLSLVEFLLFYIASKAVQEDQTSMINGSYLEPTKGVAGHYLNKMDGLRSVLFQLEEEKIAKPFYHIGEWVPGAINAFVKAMIESIPEEFRSRPGLGFYAPYDFIEAYWEERRAINGQIKDYDPDKSVITGYPNFRLLPIPYGGNTKRVVITPIGNIRQLLGFKDGEAPSFTIEKSKRVFNIFVDYKKSIHVIVAGAKSKTDQEFQERDYSKQLLWFNNVDLDQSKSFTIAPNTTVLDVKRYKYLRTPANTQATVITAIDNAKTGDIIKIECGSLTNKSTITAGGNFVLNSNFEPTEINEQIVLLARSDGKFVEIKRSAPSDEPDKISFDADDTTPSVMGGMFYKTSNSNTAPVVITNFSDAIENDEFKIYGGDGTHSTTIQNSGNFSLSAAWTGATGNFIVLRKLGNKFFEVSRNQ